MKKLRWGVLGCGEMARRMARTLANSPTSVLVAAGSRTPQGAQRFAQEFQVPRAHGSYEELLRNPEVDVIHLATPHSEHLRGIISCAHAGKHVLCEKPLTLNAAETREALAAAQHHKIFLMEAFMYRAHPLTGVWTRLLRDGAIGELKSIQASFSFRADAHPQGRLLNRSLGGGGILDVGCYPVSLARLAAGCALGYAFAQPDIVQGAGHIGETGVDEYASALLQFPQDILAEVSCGIRLGRDNTARFYGTEGRIEVADPFFCRSDVLLWPMGANKPQIIPNPAPREDLYSFEVNAVAESLANTQSDAMSWDDSLGQALTLDSWREAVGVTYLADALPPTR